MFIQTHECRLIKPIEKINQHKQKQADNYKKKQIHPWATVYVKSPGKMYSNLRCFSFRPHITIFKTSYFRRYRLNFVNKAYSLHLIDKDT